MPNFQYIAKNVQGDEVTGVMQAENELAVVRTLDEKRLYPVRVLEQVQTTGRLGASKVSMRDVGVFYSQLSDLLRAGVPMMRALETLARATSKKSFCGVIASVKDGVAGGRTLAESLASHPKVFSPLHSAMVKAGEQAGFLEDVLANLASFLERQDELRSKVRGALIYPVLLTLIGGLLMVVVLVVLVPKFQPFFVGMDLPLPSRILFAISDLLVHQLWAAVALVALAAMGIRVAVRSQSGQRLWDKWRLRIPIAGRAISMVNITRFCRILGTMLANGVPILTALSISKDASGSVLLTEAITAASENVRAGEPLAVPLRACGLFPAEIVEMIAVAEESNQLEKVLVQIADTVERRTNRQVDHAVRLIEPLILVVMAAAIGFAAVGLLYPLFTMSQAIGK